METKPARGIGGLDIQVATIDLLFPNCNPNADKLESFPTVVVETRFLAETKAFVFLH